VVPGRRPGSARHGADGQVRTACALQHGAKLASAAVRDEHVAEVLTEFIAQRRAALRTLLERGVASGDIAASADLDMLADLAYGVLWYRLLIAHAPLDADAARGLAAHLIAAGQAGSGPA